MEQCDEVVCRCYIMNDYMQFACEPLVIDLTWESSFFGVHSTSSLTVVTHHLVQLEYLFFLFTSNVVPVDNIFSVPAPISGDLYSTYEFYVINTTILGMVEHLKRTKQLLIFVWLSCYQTWGQCQRWDLENICVSRKCEWERPMEAGRAFGKVLGQIHPKAELSPSCHCG